MTDSTRTSVEPIRACDQLFSDGQADLMSNGVNDEIAESAKKPKKRKLKQNLKPVTRVTRSKSKTVFPMKLVSFPADILKNILIIICFKII